MRRLFSVSSGVALKGLVAIALLLGGGLNAPQGAAVSTGIPFTLIILVMCYCLFLALKKEQAKL
jgi:BCCT family betaine/carnitine transporter